jgi:hypothetical protein
MEMPDATILSSRLPIVESKAPRKNRCAPQRRLAHLHSIRLFFSSHIVPVVQRIEQGFLKGKTAFLQESPNDIKSIQLAVFEVVD